MSEARQCTATSKRSGERCKRRPHPGATVCTMHGAGAPQVQASARQRLLEAADPAVARLVRLIDDVDPRVAVRACQLVLDRAGCGPSSAVEVSQPGAPTVDLRKLSERTLRLVLSELRGEATVEIDDDPEDVVYL